MLYIANYYVLHTLSTIHLPCHIKMHKKKHINYFAAQSFILLFKKYIYDSYEIRIMISMKYLL